MSARQTIGGIGAILTCPCHAVPLVLLLGGTAGFAWLGRHLPIIVIAFGIVFLGSLWLLLSEGHRGALDCRTSGATRGAAHDNAESDDVLRRS